MLKNFTNNRTVKELKTENFDWSSIPSAQGVYVVVYSSTKNPSYLSNGLGGFFKKMNPNVPLEILKQNWVDFELGDDNIIYIGKAGGGSTQETLKRRIRTYIRFGSGKPSSHRGGRYIWQLANSDSLRIHWKESDNPIKEEKAMLLEFKARHSNRLPFANLRM